jgi:hypothetical protein
LVCVVHEFVACGVCVPQVDAALDDVVKMDTGGGGGGGGRGRGRGGPMRGRGGPMRGRGGFRGGGMMGMRAAPYGGGGGVCDNCFQPGMWTVMSPMSR